MATAIQSGDWEFVYQLAPSQELSLWGVDGEQFSRLMTKALDGAKPRFTGTRKIAAEGGSRIGAQYDLQVDPSSVRRGKGVRLTTLMTESGQRVCIADLAFVLARITSDNDTEAMRRLRSAMESAGVSRLYDLREMGYLSVEDLDRYLSLEPAAARATSPKGFWHRLSGF